MKICIISNAKSVHCKRWAEAIASYGHSVVVVSPGKHKEFKDVEININEFYPKGKKRFGRVFKGIKNLLHIKKIFESINPDIFHLLGLFPILAPDLKYLIKFMNKPIVTVWGTDIIYDGLKREPFKLKRAKKYILKHSNTITATGQYLADATRKYIVGQKDINIIPYGIDLNLFDGKINTDKSCLNIGIAKMLEPRYGHKFLFRAVGELYKKNKNIFLHIAGDGSLFNELNALAKEQGIYEITKFHGRLDYEDMPGFLRELDILVMPSLTEAFGVSALEASAMKIPVIATHIGGISEVVVAGKTGMLVEPQNSTAISSAIIELINDEEKRIKMGENGRKFVQDNYNWDDNVIQMLNIYKKVANR